MSSGGEHDPELADANARGLHGHEQVEQHRVVGQLEALHVEVVLGEADRVVADLVGQASLLGELGKHPVVELAAQPGQAGLHVGPAPHRRQIEQRHLHGAPEYRIRRVHRRDPTTRSPCTELNSSPNSGSWVHLYVVLRRPRTGPLRQPDR
jgi:hypothetical protein